jgi:hypothetical protein
MNATSIACSSEELSQSSTVLVKDCLDCLTNATYMKQYALRCCDSAHQAVYDLYMQALAQLHTSKLLLRRAPLRHNEVPHRYKA